MFAVLAKAKRDNLFQEISRIVRQWPERDRKVFSQSHYQGQSPQAISHSLKMEADEVRSILRKCDHTLHASLRSFLKNDRELSMPASGLKPNSLPSIYRKSA